ncbi:MAG: hypothetical protein SFY81_01490 [Verrucomicrobiota bacterium]|nr:hypothetical protein [Verrucomicrobiota bacterium]
MINSLPVAYSRLPQILRKCRLNISDLHERLKAAGLNVNPKSLYRLTTLKPIQKIDTRIVGAICETCDVSIEEVIAFEKPKPVLEKLTIAEQKRLDELMTSHSERELSRDELRELDELSEKAHQLTMANARMLVSQRRALMAQRSRNNSIDRKRAQHPKKALHHR